jgi:hypothetical protein
MSVLGSDSSLHTTAALTVHDPSIEPIKDLSADPSRHASLLKAFIAVQSQPQSLQSSLQPASLREAPTHVQGAWAHQRGVSAV